MAYKPHRSDLDRHHRHKRLACPAGVDNGLWALQLLGHGVTRFFQHAGNQSCRTWTLLP